MSLAIESPDIEAVRNGDMVALHRLYERYAPSLFSTARRITGTEADARDVVQDVFVGLPRALRTYRGSGSLGSWLRTVTARQALMMLRARRRRREVPLAGIGEHLAASPARSTVDRVWLEAAVERLPEPLRLVVVLKEIEGLSHREIARELGIAETTSMGRLYKAKGQLRRWMGTDA